MYVIPAVTTCRIQGIGGFHKGGVKQCCVSIVVDRNFEYLSINTPQFWLHLPFERLMTKRGFRLFSLLGNQEKHLQECLLDLSDKERYFL